MLDANTIRKDPERIASILLKRGLRVDFAPFLRLDAERRKLMVQLETMRAEHKRQSRNVEDQNRRGEDSSNLRATMRAMSRDIGSIEAALADTEQRWRRFLDELPNLPDEEVPAGGKEANQILRVMGDKPDFDFAPSDHIHLASRLGLVDYARGSKLGGAGFWVYVADGAFLEWGMLNLFVAAHRQDGYTFVLPPHILQGESGYAAGQFPKFVDDVYSTDDGSFLIPTSETALVNLHRDETLSEDELPKKYFAYSPCYRKESAGHGSADRGTLRGHQFNKVELFHFTLPSQSNAALEELVSKVEHLVAALGLHYRVSLVAAGDMSEAMARTIDVEVWLPSLGRYLEVSSVSHARDFQARRARIRYSEAGSRRAKGLVHTLNASALATSRLLPAILEQHQRADGSVDLPPALHAHFGKARLEPK